MEVSELKANPTTSLAGAVFSREEPDKTWQVGEETVKNLFAHWKGLSIYTGDLPPAPLTGYAGCFLRYRGDVEFFCFRGVVTLMTLNQSESREDPGRVFEQMLLSSSPHRSPGEELLS